MKKIFFLLFVAATYGFSDTINVAVAGNLLYPIKKIKKEFEKKYKNEHLNLIINSSGKLTAQIMHGAPYSVFLSANMKYPKFLYSNGKGILPPKIYAKGLLVFYSNPVIHNIKEIEKFKKIAIVEPKVGPYGKKALEVIKNAHLNVKNKLVYAETISQAFYYGLNVTNAAFVAKSVLMSDNGKKYKFYHIPVKYYTPVNQGILLIDNSNTARKFYNFMFSKDVKSILKKYGYKLP